MSFISFILEMQQQLDVLQRSVFVIIVLRQSVHGDSTQMRCTHAVTKALSAARFAIIRGNQRSRARLRRIRPAGSCSSG